MSRALTRRSFVHHSAAPAVLRAAQGTRANILLILSDDHSMPYVGCCGEPELRTPSLDRFAAEGFRFDRAFTAAPQCVPSRAALMTGRSAVSVRMTRFSSPLPPDVATLPGLLRDSGYFTGVCRRYYHLDGPIQPTHKTTQEILDRHHLRTFRGHFDFVDTSGNRLRTGPLLTEFLAKRPNDKPFFFWVNTSDPHHVWDADASANPPDPARLRVPAHLPDLPGIRSDLSRYMGEVQRLDGEVQAALDALSGSGLADNTLVVFMGDNGMAFPHGKGSLYDPGLNVPLMLRWPGRIRAGQASTTLISNEDIAPTLLEAGGVARPGTMTGRSFLPLVTGGSYEARKYVFAERGYHGNGTFHEKIRADGFDLSRCARSERFKLIYNCTPQMEYWPVDSGRDPGWQQMLAAHQDGKLKPEHEAAYFGRPRPVVELYDLAADPGELRNLAGRAEVAAAERELKLALQEKMIVDFDYLPLPLAE